MKKRNCLLILGLVCSSFIGYAQTVVLNTDFNTSTTCAATPNSCPYITPTCVPSWGSYKGTPSLSNGWVSDGPPANGQKVLNLVTAYQKYNDGINSVDDHVTEAAVATVAFQANKSYWITFGLKLPSTDNNINTRFYLKATNGLPTYGITPGYNYTASSCAQPIGILPQNQTVSEFNLNSYFPSDHYKTVDIFFVPDQNYSQLLIYPFGETATITQVLIDNVRITECIPLKRYFQNNIFLPALVQAKDYIMAGNDLTAYTNSGVLGDVGVFPSKNVAFKAGNYISLQPGFIVLNGGVFSATIENFTQTNCGSSGDDLTNAFRITSTSVFNADHPDISLASLHPSNENSDPSIEQTDLLQNLQESIQLAPNPAQTHIRIAGLKRSAESESIMQVSIYDNWGKQIYVSPTQTSLNPECVIDLTQQPRGMYVARIFYNGRWVSKRFGLH